MSSFDPETGIWLVADKDSPEHVFDFNLAVAIVEVLKFYGVKSVADLGCGLGTYCELLKLAWFFPVGFDGNPNTERLTDGRCHVLDLSQKIQIGMFDGVLSLEVGEHIPEKHEKIFIDNLCKTAGKLLILSWGIPGQDGLGHVNCRENEYIIDQVEQRGYKHNQYLSKYLRKQADLSWFLNTLMVFKKEV
jgi:SAM-dependent methyltransferase